MATKNIQIIPPGYTDVCHPETKASMVIEETDKRFMTDEERENLDALVLQYKKFVITKTYV